MDFSEFCVRAGYFWTQPQALALSDGAPTTVIVAPRQSGKSSASALLAAWSASPDGGSKRVKVVTASDNSARRILNEGISLRQSAGLGNRFEASTRVHRGESWDLMILDDPAFFPDGKLRAILSPLVRLPNTRVVAISTPHFDPESEAGQDFRRLAEDPGENGATYRWQLSDCPWIDGRVIENCYHTLPGERFAAEFYAEFPAA